MFGMLNDFFGREFNITIENDMYTVTGSFGNHFKNSIRNVIGHESKVNALFKKFSLSEISFYTFFEFEVCEIFKAIITSRYTYKVNIKQLQAVVDFIENRKQERKVELNYKLIEERFAFKILKHQEPIFQRYEMFKTHLQYRGMLLDADPGTGKTFSSLALAEALDSDKVFIICPLPTIDDVWLSSLKGIGLVYKEPQNVFHVGRDKNYNGEKFILMHYESVSKGIALFKSLNLNVKQITVIIDESHNLASSVTKRTLETIDFINMVKANDVFALSGTPIKASFKEMAVLFKLLDSKFNSKVENEFYKLYKNPNNKMATILTERYRGLSVKVQKENLKLEKPITNYVNIKIPNSDEFTLPTIKKKLEAFIIKRKKELEATKEQDHKRYYELRDKGYNLLGPKLTPKEKAEYERCVKLIQAHPADLYQLVPQLKYANSIEFRIAQVLVGEEKKEWRTIKTIFKYPHLKIQGEALGIIITGARIACHEEMAKHFDYSSIVNSTVKKTLIFGSYIKVCDAAVEKCKKDGYKPITVYGETTSQLEKTVKTFGTNKSANPLIATYKSLSTGVRLTEANVVVCMDLPFRMYVYDQAISRVWRLGQDSQVFIYIFSLDTGDVPNINSRNIDIIKFFKDEVEKLTGYKAALELDETAADNGTTSGLEMYNFYKDSLDPNLNPGLLSFTPLEDSQTRFKVFDLWS